jgi:DNA-binding NtrC family response regulator
MCPRSSERAALDQSKPGDQMATQAINYEYRLGQAAHGVSTVDEVPRLLTDTLIGSSRWAKEARRLVATHAEHDQPVILAGEPGTGKRFLARLIHQCSPYREGPFVSLTLGSTSDELTRALLFGWTELRSDDDSCGVKGLVELARGGTLYIHGLSSTAQSLTDDVIRRAEMRGIDYEAEQSVRILIGSECQSWKFFQPAPRFGVRSNDLDYERIQLPALRERPDDIETLAVHFIEHGCRQIGKELRTVSHDAVRALRGYDWPQNVRELRTLVNHLVKRSDPPQIDISILPAYVAASGGASSVVPAVEVDLDHEVKKYEIDLICGALKCSKGMQKRAAQLLRIKPTTLFMRIQRYGINVDEFK